MEAVKDIGIGMSYWPAERGVRKPTLLISLDALVILLQNESAVISPDDVPRLLGAIHSYAVKADTSQEKALGAWEEVVADLEEPDEENVEEHHVDEED